MAKYDPNEREKERKESGAPPLEGGESFARIEQDVKRVIGVAVGWKRFNSGVKGTPGLLVRFVSLDPRFPDGMTCDKQFWLTEGGMRQVGDFALCVPHKEPFDPDSDADLDFIIRRWMYKSHGVPHTERPPFDRGVVHFDVKGETYDGRDGLPKTSYRISFFGKVVALPPPEVREKWPALIKRGMDSWQNYLEFEERRAAKAAEGKGATAASGAGQSSYGDSGQSGYGVGYGVGYDAGGDDDIPF